jgi:hypothetical protein
MRINVCGLVARVVVVHNDHPYESLRLGYLFSV